jgi:hypothetical protein
VLGSSASQCSNHAGATGGPMRRTLCAHKAGRDMPYTLFPVLPPPPTLTGGMVASGRGPAASPVPVAGRPAGVSLESSRG